MFADDVMLFIKLNALDLQACAMLLQIFGEASGLSVNLSKSAALPIRCDLPMRQRVEALLGCPLVSYPCKYLGHPLMIRRQTTTRLMGLVDSLAQNMPKWRASSMPKSGRLLLIKSFLCAVLIHAMMAFDIPQKVLTAMMKICGGFLWCVSDKANDGQCAVAWEAVCTPKWAGVLDLPNLRWLNIAMQARWPWLQRTDPSRPWSEFEIEVPEESRQIYCAATRCTIGNGMHTRFWEDRWLDGARMQDVAPAV